MIKFLALALLLGIGSALGQTVGPGGGGSGSGTGTVTSIATGCQATGGTITTTGTISTQEVINSQTGSNYAIVTGDCGKLVSLSNSSAQTPTIAEAGSAGFPAAWYVDVCNPNTGAQTLTPGAGTIGGASTYIFPAGNAAAPACARIISDGVSNYVIEALAGVSAPASLTAADQTVSGGANNTAYSIGTVSSGTATIDCGKNALQYYTNGGAHTLAAPSNDGSCIVKTTNNGSAGAITFSGFGISTCPGATLDTTNTHVFYLSIVRVNSTSICTSSAGQ